MNYGLTPIKCYGGNFHSLAWPHAVQDYKINKQWRMTRLQQHESKSQWW